MSGVVVLSRLSSGWTGSITLTNISTGLTYEVTPEGRTSPAQVWEETWLRLGHLMGGGVTAWVSTDLKLHLASPVTQFTLAADGTTQSRLALTGSMVGVYSVTTASAVGDLVQASDTGVAIAPGSYAGGATAGDGVLGARPRRTSTGGGVTLYSRTYLANTLVLEALVDDGGTYDVFVDGRVVSRFRAGDVVRKRWGTKATKAFIDLSAFEVSL